MGESPVKEYERVQCTHCEGEGCTYCDRTGSVLVRKPARRCPHCEGDGCIYCGFTGWCGLKGKYDD
jgi:DnaJ-class molecular chaperone